ncbi:MAG: hypothetical protein A2103_05465 [Gammaproteobacteria bacterium GWF2_41_13]|nr:MAG: hypothetical protein A2103_05465 [Gammaproteobacteria bacterium GWF2_41_13]
MKKQLLSVGARDISSFRRSVKFYRAGVLSVILSGLLSVGSVFAFSFSDHVAAQISGAKRFFMNLSSAPQTTVLPPSSNVDSHSMAPAPSSTVAGHPFVQSKKIISLKRPIAADVATISPAFMPKTELSKKTLKLRIGMTRAEVLKVLGTPTWGQSYAGMPLDWTWKNGNCNPVDVTFDGSLHVNGFNEGRASCSDKEYQDVPDDQYLCTNPDVQVLCGLTFKYHPLKHFGNEKSHHIFVMANRDRKNT